MKDEYFKIFPFMNRMDLVLRDTDYNLITELKYEYGTSIGIVNLDGLEYSFEKKSRKVVSLLCNQSVCSEIHFVVDYPWERFAYFQINNEKFILKHTFSEAGIRLLKSDSSLVLRMKWKLYAEEKDNWFIRFFFKNKYYLVQIVDEMMERSQILAFVLICGYCMQVFFHENFDDWN
ncbi:hypothetical protein QNI19_03745 [Cytophagaceae bacterium DM2B3-1]|uniref:Uncharacterized protein n=1 Tax=Xanthocytophaga flava TaxID=3048013 RepID=A0ABT7CE58_9BACT|nr:hypothetical protein [Xanthocytophaga flavus]MDJ1492030.1 hypothetical protein [Xanthocytophaga flavus]